MGSVTWGSFLSGVKKLGDNLAEFLHGSRQPESAETPPAAGTEASAYAASDSAVNGSGSWWSRLFKSTPSTGTVGIFAGCGTSGAVGAHSFYTVNEFQSSGPIHSQCREPKPGEAKHVMLGNVIFVDNGDMAFDLNCQHDYLTDKSGNALALTDRDVQELLRVMGMDKEKAPILNLNALDDYYKVLEADVAAIKGSTDEAFVAEKYLEIANAASKAQIPSDIDSPLYKRVVAEAGRMGYAIPLGMARKSAENGYLEGMIKELAAAEAAFAQGGGIDPEFGKKIAETRLNGFNKAIANVEGDEAKRGYIDGLNRSLDSILEKAKECGILSTIEGDVKRVRVAGHMAAIKNVANDEAARGYTDGMNRSFAAIEQSAAKYTITPDIAAELFKVKKAGYLKAISDVENDEAKRGYIDGLNRSLDSILEKAKECGILSTIEGDVKRVRVAGHKAAIENVAKDEAKRGYTDGMNRSFAAIEASAAKYTITQDIAAELFTVKKDGYQNAISNVENDEAKRGYIDGLNRSLDSIRDKAKECKIFTTIEGELRRVRIAGHKTAIKNVANDEAARGYLDGMNKSLAAIETSAKRYNIFDAVKDEIRKTRDIGIANSKK